MEVIVSIVGRPNVGKSTLFNTLLKRERALTHETSGLTRDVNACSLEIAGRVLTILDTPGLVEETTLQSKMLEHTWDAMSRSSLILYTVDGSREPEGEDLFWMNWARKLPFTTILVVNKLDKKDFQYFAWHYPKLLNLDCVLVSAAHKQGIENLESVILDLVPKVVGSSNAEVEQERVKFAIVGRPNVGKSTLFNALLGKNVALVDDEPGITRDVIERKFQYKSLNYSIMDTPGLRRKSRVVTDLEKDMAQQMHKLMVHEICTVVFMLDATEGVARQDSLLIHKCLDQGFGVVLAANKWDVVDAQTFARSFETNLPVGANLPLVKISALRGTNLAILMAKLTKVDQILKKRIKTGRINRWLKSATEKLSPPYVRGRQVKLKYVTQIRTYPPEFLIFANLTPSKNYKRYIANELRRGFSFNGCTPKIFYQRASNPYTKLDK